MTGGPVRDDPAVNPNSLHDFHKALRGPKAVPSNVRHTGQKSDNPKDPGHSYAATKHVSFQFYEQTQINSPFGYEYFVSLPPTYDQDPLKQWPLILYLHGSGESQRNPGESYASIRHGIPKVILCYDKWKQAPSCQGPLIDVPLPPRRRKSKQNKQMDKSSEAVPTDVCKMVAENFVTVIPSLNMKDGYGWSAPILCALLEETLGRYRVDPKQVHCSGFSMGGYGVWEVGMKEPHRFASLTPMCGGGDVSQVERVMHIPHWIFHGAKDDIVPPNASENMYAALKTCGAPKLKYSCFEGVGHDCWTRAYNDIDLYRWMLKCKKEASEDRS